MIRILITVPLSPGVIETLNEIPEFEIRLKTRISGKRLLDEIRNADALVGGSPALDAEILDAAVDLKLILCSDPRGQVDMETARRRRVEVRDMTGGAAATGGKKTGKAKDARVIAILKDFFNV